MLLFLFYVILLFVAVAGLILAVPAIRRLLVSNQILKIFRKMLPQISQTEQEALDAGTVWWEGDLFSGKPDWKKLLAYPKPQLTAEEQAFLNGPVEQLCAMLDEWKITHELKDLPPEVWQFIKENGFFGLVIPIIAIRTHKTTCHITQNTSRPNCDTSHQTKVFFYFISFKMRTGCN